MHSLEFRMHRGRWNLLAGKLKTGKQRREQNSDS